MNTNKANAAQTVKIKIEATLPLPEAQPKTVPAKGNCADCGQCGQQNDAPLLHHTGKILMNMLGGEYTPEQIVDGFKMLDAILREHYGGK